LAAAQENNEDVDVSENKSTGQSGSRATLALKHALDYLGQRVTELDEPYLIASYALAALDASDPSRVAPAVSKLKTLSHSEGDTTYWSLEANTPFYGWGTAGRVETRAYQSMLSNTRTFGTTIVNEFRFGYNQFQNDRVLVSMIILALSL